MRRTLLPLFFLLAVTLSACGPQVIKAPPLKHRVGSASIPAKQPPPEGVVPPTQRPYRINGKTYYPLPSAHGYAETGIASWYGGKFHGRKTSNGETYDMHAMTAAHKTLPMHTYLLVQNLENGRETVVRVNDRGPFVKGRIIDLSLSAAKKLDLTGKGTGIVRITALGEARTYGTGAKATERFLPHQDFDRGEFFVQVGSFLDKANADRLKDTLISRGKKTVIVRYDRGDKIFYRVQVRGGTTKKAAARMERVLSASGFPGAFIVAR